jgi:phosphoribosylglycinamide formyltransferase 1
MNKPLRLGFLASHNGSSMKAIVAAIQQKKLSAVPCIVISNNSDSGALQFAKENSIPFTHVSKKVAGGELEADEQICVALQKNKVDIVILSGWMQKIGPKTLEYYQDRILNSHPALFHSAYKGQGFFGDKVHNEVLRKKESKTGVTIHLVDEEYDHGSVLGEVEVSVELTDTVETLRDRVQTAERKLYIEVIDQIIKSKE